MTQKKINISSYGTQTRNVLKDTPDWVAMPRFNSSYFSGLDVSVYFDDIFMDEIINIQYQEQEQVRPNFNYAGYTFDSVSHGQRIVQGSFSINFKESGYLYKLRSYLTNKQNQQASLNQLLGTKAEVDQRATISRGAIKNDFVLEDFINKTVKDSRQGNQFFGQVMDGLDEAYWNKQTPSVGGFNPNEDIKYKTINMLYTHKFYTGESGFDIIIKYGQPEDGDVGNDYGTLEVVKDCHLTSLGKSIDDSGRNILEMYAFIGKSLV